MLFQPPSISDKAWYSTRAATAEGDIVSGHYDYSWDGALTKARLYLKVHKNQSHVDRLFYSAQSGNIILGRFYSSGWWEQLWDYGKLEEHLAYHRKIWSK